MKKYEHRFLENNKDTSKEYFEEGIEKDKIVQLNVTDELGTHILQAKDFVVRCNGCKKERPLYENDIYKNEINPKACECGGVNGFSYWLDSVYNEEEYEELLMKFNSNSTRTEGV